MGRGIRGRQAGHCIVGNDTMAKKRRLIRLRFRKDDPAHNLLAAAQHFVQSKGGNAIMIGGITIEYMPGDNFKYKVAVACTGRRPVGGAT